MKTTYLPLIMLVLMCGCQSPVSWFTKSPQENKQDAIALVTHNNLELNEKSKQLNTAAKELIESIPDDYKEPQDVIANDLLIHNEKILGVPIEKIDIEHLMQVYADDVERYKKGMIAAENDLTEILKENAGLKANITLLNEQIASITWYDKLWDWIVGTSFWTLFWIVAIGGIGTFVMGPLFIPRMLSWLALKIPQLVGWLGITSIKVVKETIDGVQHARAELAKFRDDEMISAKTAKRILDGELDRKQDNDTKKTVKHLKGKMGHRMYDK